MPRAQPDPVRLAALDTLVAVDTQDAYANLVLPRLLRERRLAGRDAALATELAYGTLRGQGTYDAILGPLLSRPLDRLDPPVRACLRLGAHQLLDMRVPRHAAVSTTVDLARASAGWGAAGLVNAVLRKVGGGSRAQWLRVLAPADPVEALALEHAHPPWVTRALGAALAAHGRPAGELADLLAADNEPPALTLVARPGRAEVGELLGAGARPGRFSPLAAVLPAGNPGDLEAVATGRAGVQDEGSQLVTLALAAVRLDGPVAGERAWLDLAAGPGGKAALLAGLAEPRGAALLAVDRHPHRARLVAATLAGAAGHHLAVVADGRQPAWQAGAFDRVLLDAPCTGLGALRRRPEARWRRRPDDLAALVPLQRALLGAALDAARPGGVVAYVTCSPLPAETLEVVAAVLAERTDVVREDARAYLPGVPELGAGPAVQLWPHRHGTDAMFLALLRRTGAGLRAPGPQ